MMELDPKRVWGWCLLGAAGLILAGCAAMPSDTHAALMADMALSAGFQPDIGALHLRQIGLRPEVMTCHYIGEDDRQLCWALRFAESPFEQKPRALRDVDRLLANVSAGKADFRRGGTVAVKPADGRSVNVHFYTFNEDDAPVHGCLCVWREKLGYGAWVYVMNMVSPDALTEGQIAAILETMPGLSS